MDINDIQSLANLAKLELNADETHRYSLEFAQIISFIDKLSELDTSGLDATAHSFSGESFLRKDEINESLTKEKALMNAPKDDGFGFVLPMIIGSSK